MNEVKTVPDKKIPLAITLITGGFIIFTIAVVYICALVMYIIGYSNEKDEKYFYAIECYSSLGSLFDANERIVECERNLLSYAEVGDTVIFGNYDGPIKWDVIESDPDGVLLLASDIITCKAYNDERKITTWENSDIREWLNKFFYSKAFSTDEKELIYENMLSGEGNEFFDTDGGDETSDFVYLLSIQEARNYLDNVDTGIARTSTGKKCWWWLRSPGKYNNTAAIIRDDGTLTTYGNYVDNTDGGVRPVIWVSFNY